MTQKRRKYPEKLAASPGKSSAGADSTPLSSRDLDGTGRGRLPPHENYNLLERIIRANRDSALSFVRVGNARVAALYASRAAHFGRVALHVGNPTKLPFSEVA